jgi:hypothetical protein
MYQKFGSNYSADMLLNSQGGYEETSLAGAVTPVPEAGSLVPLVSVLGAVISSPWLRRRFGTLHQQAS